MLYVCYVIGYIKAVLLTFLICPYVGEYVRPTFEVRPTVENSFYPQDESEKNVLENLMESCWSEEPDDRPPFAYCLEVLEILTPLKGSQTAKRGVLLERETESLEQYISHDTRQIFKEKERLNDLISRVLPPKIDEEYIRAGYVEPQYYENITIMVYRVFNFAEIIEQCEISETLSVIDYISRAASMIVQLRKLNVIEIENRGDLFILGKFALFSLPTTVVKLTSTLISFKGNFIVAHFERDEHKRFEPNFRI